MIILYIHWQSVHTITFVIWGHVVDGHVMAAAVVPKVVFLALSQLCWSFVPGHYGIIKGHFTLKSSRLMLAHHNILYALCKLDWFSCLNPKGFNVRLYRQQSLLL